MNLTPGGLLGYCSSKCMTRRKVPSSKGVSEGPMITAFLRSKVSRGFETQAVFAACLVPCHHIVCNWRG
jgi:hypothetical protein